MKQEVAQPEGEEVVSLLAGWFDPIEATLRIGSRFRRDDDLERAGRGARPAALCPTAGEQRLR